MTTAVAAPPALAADLVLARLALPAKKPPAPSAVRTDVGKVFGREFPPGEYEAVRDELAAAGLVVVKGRSFRPTDAGRDRALAFLDLLTFPPRLTWQTVRAKYLFPKAVGLSAEAAGRLDKQEKLAAFLLKRKYDLPVGAGASIGQVLEALTCQLLDFPEETTLDGLLRAVLGRLLGADERLTKDQLAAQLPLFGTGLTKATAEEIRHALVRSWLATAGTEAPAPPPPEPEPASEFDLPAFAATVSALARTSPPADRFHDNKVFIAAVWRASQREDGFPRMALPAFKDRLVEANRASLLRLSRADLVQAMDQTLVAESEAAYLNATFHFVLIEGDRP